MKDAAFQELLTSVRQAGQIRRGTRRPSRTTTFHPADVHHVHAFRVGSHEAMSRPGRLGLTCDRELPVGIFMVKVLHPAAAGRVHGHVAYRAEFATVA